MTGIRPGCTEVDPATRELRIELFRYDPGHIFIRVSNNGPVIEEEELEKILIPFHPTKTAGSGIGLYISRQIIHLHHGLLSVPAGQVKPPF